MHLQVRALAPAKLNLALAVGPPGVDGMHPICSWMAAVDLHDELLVTRLPEDRFSRYAILWHEDARRRSDIDWSITRDLAVRAHQALERHVRRALPVQLKLEKRIPVGGGLGGGSSDAAAMLHAVNALYALGLSTDELAALGAGLGSDVPFLVHGGAAVVSGLGERVDPIEDAGDVHAVVVLPEPACPTADVYRRFDELAADRGPIDESMVGALATLPTIDPARLFNDLEAAALDLVPELAVLADAIAEVAERPARLSGSGSTLFVPCDDPMHAEFLARALEERADVPAIAVRGTTRPHVEAVDESAPNGATGRPGDAP